MRSFQLEIPIRLIEPGLTVVDYPSYCRWHARRRWFIYIGLLFTASLSTPGILTKKIQYRLLTVGVS